MSKKIFALVLIFLAFTHPYAHGQKNALPGKKVHLWYIVDSSATFSQIFPYRKLIASLSLFGKPEKSFIDSCRRYKIGLYLAESDTEDAIDTKEKADNMVKKYLEQCVAGGYDGIDLDYEGLSAGIQSVYTGFLRKLSTALHQRGKKLSHCVGYYPVMTEKGPNGMFYTPNVISETCDLVRVMCYDMYFAPGKNVGKLMGRMDCQGIGPTTNYSWTLEAMKFWSKFVKPDNLVMCLPAYSNDYAFGSKVTGDQVYAAYPNDNQVNVSDTTWLWYEKLTVYNYTDSLNRKHIFYASDAKSTTALLSITTQLSLKNIGFWHLSSIDKPTWQVIATWLKN